MRGITEVTTTEYIAAEKAMEAAAFAMAVAHDSEVVGGTFWSGSYWFVVKGEPTIYKATYEQPDQSISATVANVNVAQRKPAESLTVMSVDGIPAVVTVAMLQGERHA